MSAQGAVGSRQQGGCGQCSHDSDFSPNTATDLEQRAHAREGHDQGQVHNCGGRRRAGVGRRC